MKQHGTKHGTNKAFDRYCQAETIPSRAIYQTLADARKVANIAEAKKG